MPKMPVSVDEMNVLRETVSDTEIVKMYKYTFTINDLRNYAWARKDVWLKSIVDRYSDSADKTTIFDLLKPKWEWKYQYSPDQINELRKMWVSDKRIMRDLKIWASSLYSYAWKRSDVEPLSKYKNDAFINEVNSMRDLGFQDMYIARELWVSTWVIVSIAWRKYEHNMKKDLPERTIELLSDRVLNEFTWEKPVENRYWENLDWFEIHNPIGPMKGIQLLPNTWSPILL